LRHACAHLTIHPHSQYTPPATTRDIFLAGLSFLRVTPDRAGYVTLANHFKSSMRRTPFFPRIIFKTLIDDYIDGQKGYVEHPVFELWSI